MENEITVPPDHVLNSMELLTKAQEALRIGHLGTVRMLLSHAHNELWLELETRRDG